MNTIVGSASVAIKQDPYSPYIMVDADTAKNIFESSDPRIGGRRQRRKRTVNRRRRHGRRAVSRRNRK